MNILVVDHDIDTRLPIKTLLEGLKFTHVSVADSTVSVLTALRTENRWGPGSYEIGLSLLDINMPGAMGPKLASPSAATRVRR